MPWEDVKEILRPDYNEDVFMGVMEIDKEKCTKCGLCLKNCPFAAWELGEDGYPKMKEEYECFSCYNCMIPCPVDAVKIIEPYHASGGYWKTEDYPLERRTPLEPKDEDGNETEWNAIEKEVFIRRSVRNFKDKPVPESLIQRVLEAGRFAPSAGNCQPWKFIVITNKALRKQLDAVGAGIFGYIHNTYKNEDTVKNLEGMIGTTPGTFDPRLIMGGMGAIIKRKDIEGLSFGAPVIILLLGDTRSISGPQLNIGICGQNMNLVANSLGIKALWNGMVAAAANTPPLKDKLGIKEPWTAITSILLGYPKFKQEGIVPREYRPVVWFKEGSEEPEIQN